MFLLAYASPVAAMLMVFSIGQGNTRLGSASLDRIAGHAHKVIFSTVELPGALIQSTQLELSSRGWPQRYVLWAEMQGRATRIRVLQRNGSIVETVIKGRAKKNYRFVASNPVDVVDNNDLAGIQALLDRTRKHLSRGDTLRVFVPQALSFGLMKVNSITSSGRNRHNHGKALIRIKVSLKVGPRQVPLKFTVESATGQLTGLSQTKTGVEITAQSGTAPPSDRVRKEVCSRQSTISTRFRNTKLRMPLWLPTTSAAPWPSLLIVPDIGVLPTPSGRPALFPNWPIYVHLATKLACEGVATGLYGYNESAPEANSGGSLTWIAKSVASLLSTLTQDPEIDPKEVFLAGHSVGGLLALYTAVGLKSRPSGLILLDTPSKPLASVIVESVLQSAWLSGAPPSRLRALRDHVLRTLATGRTNPSRSNSPPAQKIRYPVPLLRALLSLKPAKLSADLHTPLLIVQGRKDIAVQPNNAMALAQKNREAVTVVVPQLTHALVASPLPPLSAAFRRPDQPVANALASTISDWIRNPAKTP